MGELYGEVNKLTLEWRDGLMAISVRQAVQVERCSYDLNQREIYIYYIFYDVNSDLVQKILTSSFKSAYHFTGNLVKPLLYKPHPPLLYKPHPPLLYKPHPPLLYKPHPRRL
jgi:hypothetical protein